MMQFMKKNLLACSVVIAFALVATTGALMLTSCGSEETAAPKPKPEPIVNPFTGANAEQGYDEAASKTRTVAIVVENAPDARPQWGMDDEEYSPDMVIQGEVEGGITRTLWFYADYNKMPKQLGPMRSARPPFIRFSEFFDSIFIHWGMSHSKGDYEGATTVFRKDKVDHINQMAFSNECGLFDRDSSRGVSAEHTGIIYGDKVAAAIEEKGCRNEPKRFTKFKFNKTAEPMGEERADKVVVTYSEKTDWETTDWTYDKEDKQYHTDSFKNDFKRDNLLILYDKTEYITKEGYEGPGSTGSVTYCDYSVKGGKGKLISQGTVRDIEWKKKDKRHLLLIDPEATKAAEEKAASEATEKKDDSEETTVAPKPIVEVKINPGKTWIGWVSSNNGGKVEITADESEDSEGSDDSGDSGDSGDSSGSDSE